MAGQIALTKARTMNFRGMNVRVPSTTRDPRLYRSRLDEMEKQLKNSGIRRPSRNQIVRATRNDSANRFLAARADNRIHFPGKDKAMARVDFSSAWLGKPKAFTRWKPTIRKARYTNVFSPGMRDPAKNRPGDFDYDNKRQFASFRIPSTMSEFELNHNIREKINTENLMTRHRRRENIPLGSRGPYKGKFLSALDKD